MYCLSANMQAEDLILGMVSNPQLAQYTNCDSKAPRQGMAPLSCVPSCVHYHYVREQWGWGAWSRVWWVMWATNRSQHRSSVNNRPPRYSVTIEKIAYSKLDFITYFWERNIWKLCKKEIDSIQPKFWSVSFLNLLHFLLFTLLDFN